MKSFVTLLFVLLQFNALQAQERFFEYMPGWINNYSTEVEDGYLLLGLGSNQPGHFHLYNEIDESGNLVGEHTYAVDSVANTSGYWTAQRGLRIGDVVYSVGLFGNPAQGNIFYGGLFRYDIATSETELVQSYADDEFVVLSCIAQKSDTSLLTAGIYANNFNLTTLMFREIDMEGNIQWSFEESCNGNCNFFSHTILPLSNGHSALLVNAFNANFPTFEDREKSILIVVDQEGEELWRVEPGPHQDYKTLPGGLLEIDGSILLCYTDPYYYDNTGQWQPHAGSTIHLVSYGLDGELHSETDLSDLIPDLTDPVNPDGRHNITQLIKLEDDRILFCGHTMNGGLLLKYGLGGELVWMRHHRPHPLIGFQNAFQRTEIYHTLQTSDGGFLCTGQYFTFPFELEPAGQQTAFALKVDQYGCLEEGCQGSLNTAAALDARTPLRLWPNPARDRLNVEVPTGVHPQTLDFIDATGRTVWSLAHLRTHHGPALQADLSLLPAGFYLLRLTTSEGDVYTGKLLVQ